MSDAPALVDRLLDTLDALGSVARHLHPSQLEAAVGRLGDRDHTLRAAYTASADTTSPAIAPVVETTLRICEQLRGAIGSQDGLRAAYRALRHLGRVLEALYPLASVLPSVSRFFLEPSMREDHALLDSLAAGGERVGVMHAANETGERGGFSLYVPENYDPTRAYPLVMALHGGSGHGRTFLWSWLREARSRGVILVAPTAIGDTWSLMQPELDSENLTNVLEQIAQDWNVDRTHLLLTGMSDGGTFTLLSGLDDASPFTHLAPVAASFHPLLLTMAEPVRVTGLPVYLVHGALDWMFPVSIARTAHRALTAAGARVTYREIADLSHTYPRDENAAMLDWFMMPNSIGAAGP
jgi:phospholipase/carboxylesterase